MNECHATHHECQTLVGRILYHITLYLVVDMPRILVVHVHHLPREPGKGGGNWHDVRKVTGWQCLSVTQVILPAGL